MFQHSQVFELHQGFTIIHILETQVGARNKGILCSDSHYNTGRKHFSLTPLKTLLLETTLKYDTIGPQSVLAV